MPGIAHNLGFPRIGPNRELKTALERYWSGGSSAEELQRSAAELRAANWRLQADAGIGTPPSNDFSLYDHVLDTAVWLGALPQTYRIGEEVDLDGYFAAARGGELRGEPVSALEMTKWFDTNYHYIVAELSHDQTFALSSVAGMATEPKPLAEYREARALGIETRPVLLGPLSFLALCKQREGDPGGTGRAGGTDRAGGTGREPDLSTHTGAVVAVYAELLEALAGAGARTVQIDEPLLVTDIDDATRHRYRATYETLRSAASSMELTLATYFSGLRDNLDTAIALPVDVLHLDLIEEPGQLDEVLVRAPDALSLSLGLVDGRNVWRSDLDEKLAIARRAIDAVGIDRIRIAPSCSLLHLPVDLDTEGPVTSGRGLDEEVRQWLAFATQRLEEVRVLSAAIESGEDIVAAELDASRQAARSRRGSPRVHDPGVALRMTGVTAEMEHRTTPYDERRRAHRERFGLPLLPTTTIGSFPQTAEVRAARAGARRGELGDEEYRAAIERWITDAIHLQESIGLDVLVHGEFERNDMVEYFGEHLAGFIVTRNGWVQSYGSRCVKPPIIYGDVSRPEPITLGWAHFAQSLTDRPVKGMLTGPVTILEWSFVRDDQPRAETARQIALAVRDEVADLEAAGIGVIQIDEPALREGLPLRVADRPDYLDWAIRAFGLASSVAGDDVGIHTHMCYGEFADVIDAIAAFDADAISLETARSEMELLDTFASFDYPNEVGPGVWDIHSPRVPEPDEMAELLHRALEVLPADRLWVNPDCGLKTRGWAETEASLRNLVEAAERVRIDVGA